MKIQKMTGKFIKLLITVLLLFNIGQCSFQSIDKMNENVLIGDGKVTDDQITQLVVTLSNATQGHIFIDSTDKVQLSYSQEGVVIGGPFEIFATETASFAPYSLGACSKSNGDLVILMSSIEVDPKEEIYAVNVAYDGTTQTIGTVYKVNDAASVQHDTAPKCSQVSGDDILIVWQNNPVAGGEEIHKAVLNVSTGVFTQAESILNTYNTDKQISPSIDRLQGSNSDKFVVTWTGQGVGCTDQFDFQLFYSILNEDSTGVAGQIDMPLGDCGNSGQAVVKADQYGGFVVVYSNLRDSKLGIQSVDTDLTTLRWGDSSTIGVGYSPNLVIHKEQIFVMYMEASTSQSNIKHKIFDLKSKAIHKEYTSVYTNIASNYGFTSLAGANLAYKHQSMQIMKDTDSSRIVCVQILFNDGTNDKVHYFEYFLGNDSQCLSEYYSDCYGSNTEVVCAGTTLQMRQIRKRPDNFQCTCQDGYFHSETKINCQKCDSVCVTCNTITGCLSCTNADFLLPFCNQEVCPNGYYRNSSSCLPCNSSCFTCDDNTACTECKDKANLLPSCQSDECPYGEFKSGNSCTPCASECGSCESLDKCDTCADQELVAPLCTDSTCPVGQFLEGMTCVDCAPECAECQFDTECTVCADSNNLIPQCTDSQCGEGYFRDGSICSMCDYSCKECTEAGSCTVCKDDNFLPSCIYPKAGFLSLTLPDGSIDIQACETKCNACEDSVDNCTGGTCRGRNREVANQCNCILGYHDSQKTLESCEQCPVICKSCINEYYCSTCHENQNRQLNQFTGKCTCKKGYKEQVGTNICIKCYQVMDGCTDKCPANTIQNEVLHICEPINYELTSNSTLIIIFGIIVTLVQILLCIGIRTTLNRQYSIFTGKYVEQVETIKQQRQIIYKNGSGLDISTKQSMLFNSSSQSFKKKNNRVHPRNSNLSITELHSQNNLLNLTKGNDTSSNNLNS